MRFAVGLAQRGPDLFAHFCESVFLRHDVPPVRLSSYTQSHRLYLQIDGTTWSGRRLTALSSGEYSREIPFGSADSGEIADAKACGGLDGDHRVGGRGCQGSRKNCAICRGAVGGAEENS